ncbi:MBL fold metallo-hydrolase [Elizabethkingia argentiflava]|uniref:MBL fold metallo-hydrolase n=1 Tax=Elizabethkingia argenteiflava TaxID=2681556 RepID=A0A845PQ58_9FLAO|nr:MBL fold metallo-hydrolase [Elizabethkingia argenteiflava]NAW49954.1 MBL fold metallo-hydrolase [Elizabethkingia argenteiflava]
MLNLQIFSFNPFSENTYIVYNNKNQAWLVDPGNSQPYENDSLKHFIDEKELKVEKILLTHAHIDHILGLQWAHDTYKVPVYLHPKEEEILKMGSISAQRFGFNFFDFEGDLKFIDEHNELHLGEHLFHLFFTPGHSPGSLSYYNAENKLVISGDVLFQGSIGRTDLYKANFEQLMESIERQLLTLPNDTQVFSGHGKPTFIGIEKENNPFLKKK